MPVMTAGQLLPPWLHLVPGLVERTAVARPAAGSVLQDAWMKHPRNLALYFTTFRIPNLLVLFLNVTELSL